MQDNWVASPRLCVGVSVGVAIMDDVTRTPAATQHTEETMSTAVAPKLLTAEEYFALPDDG